MRRLSLKILAKLRKASHKTLNRKILTCLSRSGRSLQPRCQTFEQTPRKTLKCKETVRRLQLSQPQELLERLQAVDKLWRSLKFTVTSLKPDSVTPLRLSASQKSYCLVVPQETLESTQWLARRLCTIFSAEHGRNCKVRRHRFSYFQRYATTCSLTLYLFLIVKGVPPSPRAAHSATNVE